MSDKITSVVGDSSSRANQEQWYTLEECFEQAGRKFPFEIRFVVMNLQPQSYIITSKSLRGWETADGTFWPNMGNREYQLVTSSPQNAKLDQTVTGVCVPLNPCRSNECRSCVPNFL